MSKKKFKSGLESLFGEMGNDRLPGIRDLLVEEEEDQVEVMVENPVKKITRPSSSKNFTSDLDDLFHNAFDQPYKSSDERESMTAGRDTTIKKRNLRPVIGIDALIRRTAGEEPQSFRSNSPTLKRVTFALDKQKIEHLKNIAKSKKSYLKDVVDEIISDYLKEHPNQAKSTN